MRMTVLGAGYLGATHAACMAELGHEVVAVDTDAGRVAMLAEGRAPFFEPELEPLLRKHTESGRLRFTTSLEQAAPYGDLHFVCVGTPQLPGRPAADTSAVEGVVADLAPLLRPGSVVAGKSTVPVGLAARLREQVLSAGAELVWNPEFLREGHAVEDTLNPDRIVVGASCPDAVAVLREAYADPLSRGTPFLEVALETAELVKVAANCFLATKVSFVNAMAEVCEAAGADVVELADAVGYDDRIGHRFLAAGLGFGGGCLPKDLRAFQARANELGAGQSVRFLAEVDEINLRRRGRVVALAHELLGGPVAGCRIAALGAAFKPGSDDIRDSPALDVADQLYLRGADVVVYDPEATESARRHSPRLTYAAGLAEAVTDSDLVLLLTEWPEIVAMEPDAVGARVRGRRIVDARNVLDPGVWRSAGWEYRALGRADGRRTNGHVQMH